MAAVGPGDIVCGYLANPCRGFYLRSRTRRAVDGGDASTLEGVLGSAMPTRGENMRAFLRLTPNLVVRDVERSIRFYCDVLDFELDKHVPEKPPFVFASVRGGGVEIFLNEYTTVVEEYPAFGTVPLGGTLTLYLAMQGVDDLYSEIRSNGTRIVMPIETKFYGVREFAVADPDGYILTLAERVD